MYIIYPNGSHWMGFMELMCLVFARTIVFGMFLEINAPFQVSVRLLLTRSGFQQWYGTLFDK
jgi:hypothetical protein